MRDSIIYGKFQHLGVDHDQAALIRCQLVKQRQDHGVDRHGFARTGGSCDQQMGHFGEVGDHAVAANILTKRQRQRMRAVAKIARGENFTQDNFFAFVVWQLDTDHCAAGHGRNPRRERRHRPGDIISQTDNPACLQAGCRFQFIHGDNGTGAH